MITLRGRIKKDILNGNITEQLILFLFPLFLGYLLQQLYGFVDNIVLGRLISKEALAAVGGSANSLIN
ncbi:MAG: MATE family efflux transporter, partial [Erysipelotrichaceae bacterium]|nr:MATE family efflux transporter [Erysipelotrichaceae bacterium]